MKVLIADDNPMFRLLLEKHVRGWGYESVTAEDGLQAWKILTGEQSPRVAILDWQMPGLDGIEICHRLKRSIDLPFVYTILLTSRDTREDTVFGLESGADDYLTKPVDAKILRSRLAVASRIVEAVPPQEWALPKVPGYEVFKVLGKGATGTVWRAIQSTTGRAVALKIIRPDLVTEEVFTRFGREIQITQGLDHPNIARVYDSRVDRTLCYYAMELIDGKELGKHVHEEKTRPRDILRLIVKVCDGIEHAHRVGVVHRDLKPANILVTRQGEPKVVDFGLAKAVSRTHSSTTADTEADGTDGLAHLAVGTPLYMAPEQARGETDRIDARSDVYAIGVILYTLLIGHHPHKLDRSDKWAVMRSIAEGEFRRPSVFAPNIDPVLEGILVKALAREPADRYASAGALGVELKRCLARPKSDPSP